MTPSSSSSRNRLSDLLSSLEGEILVRVVMLCVFFVTEELQPFHRVIHKVGGSKSFGSEYVLTFIRISLMHTWAKMTNKIIFHLIR